MRCDEDIEAQNHNACTCWLSGKMIGAEERVNKKGMSASFWPAPGTGSAESFWEELKVGRDNLQRPTFNRVPIPYSNGLYILVLQQKKNQNNIRQKNSKQIQSTRRDTA